MAALNRDFEDELILPQDGRKHETFHDHNKTSMEARSSRTRLLSNRDNATSVTLTWEPLACPPSIGDFRLDLSLRNSRFSFRNEA